MEKTAVLPEKAIDLDIESMLDDIGVRATREYKLGYIDGQAQTLNKATADLKKDMAGPAEMFYQSLLKVIPKEDIYQHRIGTDYTTGVPTTLTVISCKHQDKMRDLHYFASDIELRMYHEFGIDCQFWVMVDSGNIDQHGIERDFPLVRGGT